MKIYELRRLGHTLDEIGRRFNITRERVRQILLPLPLVSIPRQAERNLMVAQERGDEVLAAFRELRSISQAAERLGLDVAAVRVVVHENEPDMRMYAATPAGSPRFTDDDLLDALRAVASANATQRPTADQYRAYCAAGHVLADGRPFPGLQTLRNRLGSLVEARRQAGLTPGTHAGPPKRWTEDQAAEAVWTLWQQLGQAPTVSQYDEFCRGNASVPSGSIVRRRIGGGWANILRTAKAHATGETSASQSIEGAAPESLPEPTSRVWGGPGRLPAPARRAVELHAMGLARERLEQLGWEEVIDTSASKPWDLVARREGVAELRVEVKGTTGDGSHVELTRNEVENARSYAPVCLIIVSEIALDDAQAEVPTASGGRLAVHTPWVLEDLGELEPTMFVYHLR